VARAREARFPQHIVVRRVRATKVVSRLPTVPPGIGDSAYCFEWLREILGVYPTFQEPAATTISLFAGQSEAEGCHRFSIAGRRSLVDR
jgi:hypothetical protein